MESKEGEMKKPIIMAIVKVNGKFEIFKNIEHEYIKNAGIKEEIPTQTANQGGDE